MLISVIVPCYNVELTVRKTLDSLLSQSFTDYEIIAVNDGSKDSTLSILKEYENRYPMVKVIDKPNGGVSSARNKGLDVAKGDYIFFLDSDDYVYPSFFQEITEEIKKKKEPEIITFGFFWEKKNRDVIPTSTGVKYFKRFLLGYDYIMIWSFIAKRSIYEYNHLRFDTTITISEDYHLFFRLFYISQDIHSLSKVLICYSDNADSAMHKKISPAFMSSLDAFVKLEEFYINQNAPVFFIKAMRNLLIQNYLSLRIKYLKYEEKRESIDSVFLKYRTHIPMFPPFQIGPFWLYNVLYTWYLFFYDSEFRRMIQEKNQ